MSKSIWAFISIYCLLLVIYMVTKVVGRKSAFRAVNKMMLVIVYLAVVIYTIFKKADVYNILVLVALIFAGAGDAFLLCVSNRNKFHAGVVSFGISNFMLIVISLAMYGWQWWSIVIFVVLYCINVLLQYKKVYTYGKSKWFLNIYLIFVGYSGCLGLANAIVATTLPAILYGVGAFMFFVSDILLGMYYFKFRKSYVDVLNSLLYFGGIILIAISFTI